MTSYLDRVSRRKKFPPGTFFEPLFDQVCREPVLTDIFIFFVHTMFSFSHLRLSKLHDALRYRFFPHLSSSIEYSTSRIVYVSRRITYYFGSKVFFFFFLWLTECAVHSNKPGYSISYGFRVTSNINRSVQKHGSDDLQM